MPFSPGRWRRLPLRAPGLGIILSVALIIAFTILQLVLSGQRHRDAEQDARRIVGGVAASMTDEVNRVLEVADLVLIEMAERAEGGAEPWDASPMRPWTRVSERTSWHAPGCSAWRPEQTAWWSAIRKPAAFLAHPGGAWSRQAAGPFR